MRMTSTNLISVLKKSSLLLAFAVFLGAVSLSMDSFLSIKNILDVLRQVSITGMIAIGTTFVVITGRLDLTVGSMLTLLTVLLVDQHNQVGPLLRFVWDPWMRLSWVSGWGSMQPRVS
jgi:ribose transport system permease protein